MRNQIREAAQGLSEKCAPPSAAFIKKLECWRRRYRLEADFVGFQGHFAENPVLPALAQVFMAQDMIESLLGRPATLSAIAQAKFLAPVGPGRTVSVYGAENGQDWRFHLTVEGASETDVAFLRLNIEAHHGF